MFTPHHVSHVTCHISRVRCHVSGVTCQVSHVRCHFFFSFFLTKWWSFLGEGLLSTGPTPSSLSRQTDSQSIEQEPKNRRKKAQQSCEAALVSNIPDDPAPSRAGSYPASSLLAILPGPDHPPLYNGGQGQDVRPHGPPLLRQGTTRHVNKGLQGLTGALTALAVCQWQRGQAPGPVT